MHGFRFRQMLACTGATRSQLIYWTDTGLISADLEDTAGTGHHRAFSFRNLIQVRVTVLLAQRGLSVNAIAFVLRALKLSGRVHTYAEIVWIPAAATTIHAVWMGSVQEFAAELRRPMAGGGSAGIVIKLQEVVAALKAATTDRE